MKLLWHSFLLRRKQKERWLDMRKGAKRLNYADRQRIESMKKSGAKVTEIAQAVGVHRATIYNELKRGGEPYRAEIAQKAL
nr:MAG TPA: RNaseH [Caudoviricetes sp.]